MRAYYGILRFFNYWAGVALGLVALKIKMLNWGDIFLIFLSLAFLFGLMSRGQ
jgi:hypothetical protein